MIGVAGVVVGVSLAWMVWWIFTTAHVYNVEYREASEEYIHWEAEQVAMGKR
jgi:hypothetical protein